MISERRYEQHPLLVAGKIAACCGPDLVFSYSRYEIAQPGLQAAAPRSDVLRVCARDVTLDWLTKRLAELGPAEEIAWHSRVERKGAEYHIPMIDFIDHPALSELHKIGGRVAKEMGLRGDFVFFETGQSFHGYLPELIPERAWFRYLGFLLLLNEYDRPPVIDSRWVGHALTRGFAALRWSHNTSRYLAMPHLVSALASD